MPFEKGKSGNPYGRQRTPKPNETLALSVVSLSVPDFPSEQRDSVQLVSNVIIGNEEWIPFGSDNLFPQAIAKLNRQSPVHRGIMNMKCFFLKGKGFIAGENEKKLQAFIDKANVNGESLRKIGSKLLKDDVHSGNAFVEIVKAGKFVSLYHKDYTTCRLSKDGKQVLIHSDWERVNSSKDKIKRIPLYPAFEKIDGAERSIFHFKTYEPEFEHYGIPDWVSALDAAGICYKTNKWNISRLDNSMISSGVLLVEGNLSPKEAKKLKGDFKKEFTGEGKQGKVLFLVKQLGGGSVASTTFTPFNATKDADWLNLHKQAAEDLISAHSWFPSLSGRYAPGQLGNTQQIRNEYQIAMGTVIQSKQEQYLEAFQKIIQEQLNIDASSLLFRNELPISISDLLDPKQILSKNEQRALFGYEEVEEAVTQALNGAQVQAMVQVLTTAANGGIPRESAVNILVKAFGLTQDDAEAIVANIGKGFQPIKEEA